jgi:hypothetical protein
VLSFKIGFSTAVVEHNLHPPLLMHQRCSKAVRKNRLRTSERLTTNIRFQMKVLRTILIVFVLTQISASCQLYWGCDRKNELRQLTEESKKWTPYELKTKLIFESDSSQDTIFVTQYQEDIESFFRGDECPEGKMEIVKAKLIGKLFSDTISFKIELEDNVLLENKDFLIEYRDSGKYLTTIDNSKSYNATLTIKQRTFTDAIVSKCPSCDKLNEIVFAKNLGLVAYKIGDIYWTRK